MKAVPSSFSISFIDGKTEQINQKKTLARVKSFYKGRNRNGTYINDKIAMEIVKDGAGSPIIGTYDSIEEDFTQHNRDHSKTKAYGFVPFETNFAWENYLDEDGVERSYACFDVILWTRYYEEANKIIGQPQSMELDPTSIDGTWVLDPDTGVPYFVYTHAELLGFCVLGEDVEPCFEGASFYSTQNYEFVIKKLLEFKKNLFENGGMSNMQIVFNGDHPENYMTIFNQLNPQTENSDIFSVGEIILDLTDNSLITYVCGDRKVKKYSYSAAEDNSVSFTLESENELSAYSIQEKPEQDYESLFNKISEDYKELLAKYELAEAKIKEEDAKTALVNNELAEAKSTIARYELEVKNINEEKKKNLVADYSKLIDMEALKEIDFSTYSYNDLENLLAKEYVKQKADFSLAPTLKIPIANPNGQERPLVKILSGYINS